MSAAAERAAFAAAGRDLLAVIGDAGERRSAGLTRPLADSPPIRFDTLLGVPAWLRWSRTEQARLARLVAVRSMASALATSIDGAWLGAIAEAVGEDAVDWAIALGAETGEPEDIIQPDDLAAHGLAILRVGLPTALRGYLACAPANLPASASPLVVEQAVAFAEDKRA